MKKIITFIVVGALMLSTNAAVFANSTTTSMSVGTTHTGLVKEDGQLVMWGMNEYGEFGIGKTSMFKQGFTDSEKDVVSYRLVSNKGSTLLSQIQMFSPLFVHLQNIH